MAKIKNMHYTICLKVISSSAQVALPPAFARLEQRGVSMAENKEKDWLWWILVRSELSVARDCNKSPMAFWPFWKVFVPLSLIRNGSEVFKYHIYVKVAMDKNERPREDGTLRSVQLLVLGAVHILRQPKTGVPTPPPSPLRQQWSAFGWPPSPLRQQWSAFSLPPLPPSSAMVSIWLTPLPPSSAIVIGVEQNRKQRNFPNNVVFFFWERTC